MSGRGGIFTLLVTIGTAVAFHVGSVVTTSTTDRDTRVVNLAAGDSQSPEQDLLRTLYSFDKRDTFESPLDRDGACLANSQAQKFDWLIATVPDPELSNLKLDFDREIESIQIAAGASGYLFDRFWFPWAGPNAKGESPSLNESSAGSKAGKSRRNSGPEHLPGLMIFRRGVGEKGSTLPELAIFLVGETPTGGIRPRQFRNAVCYGKSVGGGEPNADRTLRIIGPAFSGSFYSLDKLTDGYQANFDDLVVRSWSSDMNSQQAFQHRSLNRHPRIDLKTTRAPSVLSINKFVSYVRNTWRDNGLIILLTEEGTGFAAGVTKGVKPNIQQRSSKAGEPYCQPSKIGNQPAAQAFKVQDPCVFTLNFPRSIYRLRNASDNPTHLPAISDDSRRTEIPRSGLLLSLKEDEQPMAEVPSYSKQQTPISQESVLFSIGSLLKTDTVHYVGIIATDPLDFLFLSRYLRSACPNLRLFTLDSDLLFEHGSDSGDYTGVLAVTTYPLFPMSQLWTGSPSGLHVFPSSTFESMYNATVDVLSTYLQKQKSKDLRDYRDPFHAPSTENAYPPIWITVAGSTGYAPIDVLTLPAKDLPEQFLMLPAISAGPARIIPEYWPGWGYAFSVIVILSLIYCFLILSASPEGNRVIAIFAAKPDEPNSLPRAFYLFSLGICLAVLVALWIVVPGLILRYNLTPSQQLFRFGRLGAEAVLLFFGAAALVIFIRTMTLRHRSRGAASQPSLKSGRNPRANAVSAALGVAGFIAIAAACNIGFRQSSSWNQPSPVLPLFWVFFCFGCFAIGATSAASVVPLWDSSHSKNRLDAYSKAGGLKRVLLMPYLWATLLVAAIGGVLVVYAYETVFTDGQRREAHFLAACRSLDLTSNVSPLLPVTMLMISLTALAFVQLRRVTYHEDRCPKVPNLHGDPFCPKLGSIVHEIRKRIRTFSFHPVHFAAFLVFFVFLFCAFVNRGQQTLENRWLEALIMSLSFATGFFIVLIWIRVLLVWSAFSEFLQQLERHPLRHVFSLLPRGFVWSPVWQGGGKRRIHVAVTRSLECILALQDHLITDPALKAAIDHPKVKCLEDDVTRLLRASASRRRVTSMFYRRLEKELSATAEDAARYLEKAKWPKGNYELKAELSRREETKDALRTSAPEYKEHEPETICGELVAFRFLAFINYVLLQLHTLVGYTSFGFLLLVVALNCYEFRARTIIDWLLVLMFVFISAGTVTVFAQADRDPILSRITGTEAGKLDRHFFTHLISYGALPSLALAATHFPTIGRFFFSWVKPALESIH